MAVYYSYQAVSAFRHYKNGKYQRINLPNTTVKYHFEHSNGKKSDLKTVKTDHSKTAIDAHWYNVPKNPHGEEAGSNTWQTRPSSSSAAPSQRFEIRYSLTANQQSVILTPY